MKKNEAPHQFSKKAAFLGLVTYVILIAGLTIFFYNS